MRGHEKFTTSLEISSRNIFPPPSINNDCSQTSFPGLSYEDEGRDEKALVWAGHVTIYPKNGSILQLLVKEWRDIL
jgi:hypothetical protein